MCHSAVPVTLMNAAFSLQLDSTGAKGYYPLEKMNGTFSAIVVEYQLNLQVLSKQTTSQGEYRPPRPKGCPPPGALKYQLATKHCKNRF